MDVEDSVFGWELGECSCGDVCEAVEDGYEVHVDVSGYDGFDAGKFVECFDEEVSIFEMSAVLHVGSV